MTINIIVALNEEGYIGNKGKLLYRIKKDLESFRKRTTGHHCLMGRTTFQEINKPLPKRTTVVLSSDKNLKVPNGVIVETSFDKILNNYLESGIQNKDLFICGGSGLYELALPYTDKVFITYIHDDKKGDVKFPYEIVKQQFKEVHRESHEEDGINFEFIDYERKYKKERVDE